MLILFTIYFNLIFCHSIILTNNNNDRFYELPRFWTNTGFCPSGSGSSISDSLLTNDVRHHLNLIGALPNNAIATIRVHWLLDLLKFVQFRAHNIPEYNFDDLDKFLYWINEAGLTVGFEFMGNPGSFNQKKVSNSFIWKDLSFQIAERYLELFGTYKLMKWRFESWNEPDLKTYNKFNFTTEEYLDYLASLKFGLEAASRRTSNNSKLFLHGPAGLFKSKQHHPLCWSALELCNKNPSVCPFDVLTFHRKGQGKAEELFDDEHNLILELYQKYENLTNLPISNDEADPIAGWSTPRPFQSDIRYAIEVIKIILNHWSAMLNLHEYRNFRFISHDNAFLSYHPYEFDQRTLFARFQMNLSHPVYSEFIPKPVYTLLGMLGNLGQYAEDVEFHSNYAILNTCNDFSEHKYYLSRVIVSSTEDSITNLTINLNLPKLNIGRFAYCLEVLETNESSPVNIWNLYGNPSYPNRTVRELMRRSQGPKILELGVLKPQQSRIELGYQLKSPWIAMLRVCSSNILSNLKPQNLNILQITHDAILITWKEIFQSKRCIKTYEIQFLMKQKPQQFMINKGWKTITKGWTVPFLSFHFHPENGIITGYYKVRAVDIFGEAGPYSKIAFFA